MRPRPPASNGAKPAEIRLDYATYNLSSLVLQKNGWLEKEFEADGIAIKWVFSAGSNKANEFISSNSADFASTAGAAALLARTNGVPLKTVYVYSKPEWTALVVSKDSTVAAVADLKGKKIAVTRGTDPFFFLLRSLKEAGLSQSASRSSICSTAMAGWRCSVAMWTPGLVLTRTWPRPS